MTAFRFWETPEFTGVGRLPGRATSLPYATSQDALAARDPRVLSLDGDWAFRLCDRPEDTPVDFPSPQLDDSGWARVAVPGNFTMQGYGNPQYTNVQMPFRPNRPPYVPEQNPTGLYRTTFTTPSDWNGLRIVLHVGAATSVSTVWVNGTRVGIGKDSRLPSEYDVTDALVPGENLLAVQVIQWSDASYIEDQDQWWQAGINRSVYLYATPRTHLADVAVTASYDHGSGSGSLRIGVQVGDVAAEGWSVVASLHDGEGNAVLAEPLRAEAEYSWGHSPDDGPVPLTTELTAELPAVDPWSAEIPTLYTLTVGLLAPDGTETDATSVRVGFRMVEVRDRQLLVNGKPVYIRGVNRHEHHDRFGSAVPRETVLTDVKVLKAFNVNAVRTSHYPPDPYFLELADEYGLYVIDEADIESHANYDSLCDDPRYQSAWVDRVGRMVLRDRNHPSIILWSLGNEAGYGANHDAAAAWVRRVDPSRPVHYEGAINGGWQAGHHATDIVCPMYPSVDAIVEWAETTTDDRPLIMCEYAHAMGNSCGNLADYWDAIESHHGLQGGFIWEMLDHGIAKRTGDGREYWGYGGDFGEEIHDGNFVCDGLFWPDRTPHPAMWEAKHLFQPFRAELDGDTLRITNRYDFRDLSHLRITAEVSVDGAVVEETALPALSTGPGRTAAMPRPWSLPSPGRGEEALVTLRFVDSTDVPLLGRDHEVGWIQLPLGTGPDSPGGGPDEAGPEAVGARRAAAGARPVGAGSRPVGAGAAVGAAAGAAGAAVGATGSAGAAGATAGATAGAAGAAVGSAGATAGAAAGAAGARPSLTVEHREGESAIRGENVEFGVRRSDGALTAWRVNGVDLLAAGPAPTVWRAPTDNDGLRLFTQPWQTRHKAYNRWLEAGLDRLVAQPVEVSLAPLEDCDVLSPVNAFPWVERHSFVACRRVRHVAEGQALGLTHTEYLVFQSDGSISAAHEFDIDAGLTDLGRVGVVAQVPPGFEDLEWFGRGPHESYVDRKRGAAVGRWRSTVDEQYVPYVLPQEHGNKTDVRWLALRREDGTGLLVSAGDLVEAKASHHRDEALGTARHTVDLVREDVTYLAIDVRQRGLGGASCGPDTLERYQVPSGTTYRLRYRLIPLGPGDDPARQHRR